MTAWLVCSRIAGRWLRPWPAARSSGARKSPALALEQLSDRTLLSVVFQGPWFDPAVFPNRGALVSTVRKLENAARHDAGAADVEINGFSKGHSGKDRLQLTIAFSPEGVTLTVSDEGDQGDQGDRGDEGNRSSVLAVLPPDLKSLSSLAAKFGATTSRSETATVSLAGLEADNAEIVVGDGMLAMRGRDGATRVPGEQDALAYLAGPYLDVVADRRTAANATPLDAAPREGSAPGDVVALSMVVPESSTDDAGVSRSMAAVFRELAASEESGAELPASRLPEVLVSYLPENLPSRVELVPLEDGSQALVAALVADVTDGNAAEPPCTDLIPAGSPVGTEPGPAPELAPAATEAGRVGESEWIDEDLPPSFVELGRARDSGVTAESALFKANSFVRSAELGRQDTGALDAVFAAGLIPLSHSVEGRDARERWQRHVPRKRAGD
jgi:hypothetical protein